MIKAVGVCETAKSAVKDKTPKRHSLQKEKKTNTDFLSRGINTKFKKKSLWDPPTLLPTGPKRQL